MVRSRQTPPPQESREFRSVEEIDSGIAKLQRRIQEIEKLDVPTSVIGATGEITAIESNVRDSIRDVFGPNSPEFNEHQYFRIWAGGQHMNMTTGEIINRRERGRTYTIGLLNGLIGRL